MTGNMLPCESRQGICYRARDVRLYVTVREMSGNMLLCERCPVLVICHPAGAVSYTHLTLPTTAEV